MPERIDQGLAVLAEQGQSVKTIYVGSELFYEIYDELNPIIPADLIRPGQTVPPHQPARELKEYKGIQLILLNNEESDYLKLELNS